MPPRILTWLAAVLFSVSIGEIWPSPYGYYLSGFSMGVAVILWFTIFVER